MKTISSPYKHQRGIATIEFAFGAFLLFWLVFACFELSRYFYCINLVETAVRDAARDTRVSEMHELGEQYDAMYKAFLNNKHRVWRFMLDDIDIERSEMRFYDSLEAVLADQMHSTPSTPFAKVTVRATYHPLYLLTDLVSIDIKRSALLVQEHEGWEPIHGEF